MGSEDRDPVEPAGGDGHRWNIDVVPAAGSHAGDGPLVAQHARPSEPVRVDPDHHLGRGRGRVEVEMNAGQLARVPRLGEERLRGPGRVRIDHAREVRVPEQRRTVNGDLVPGARDRRQELPGRDIEPQRAVDPRHRARLAAHPHRRAIRIQTQRSKLTGPELEVDRQREEPHRPTRAVQHLNRIIRRREDLPVRHDPEIIRHERVHQRRVRTIRAHVEPVKPRSVPPERAVVQRALGPARDRAPAGTPPPVRAGNVPITSPSRSYSVMLNGPSTPAEVPTNT